MTVRGHLDDAIFHFKAAERALREASTEAVDGQTVALTDAARSTAFQVRDAITVKATGRRAGALERQR